LEARKKEMVRKLPIYPLSYALFSESKIRKIRNGVGRGKKGRRGRKSNANITSPKAYNPFPGSTTIGKR